MYARTCRVAAIYRANIRTKFARTQFTTQRMGLLHSQRNVHNLQHNIYSIHNTTYIDLLYSQHNVQNLQHNIAYSIHNTTDMHNYSQHNVINNYS